MTSKEIKKIWNKFKDDKVDGMRKFYSYIFKNYGAQLVATDWKDVKSLITQFSKILKDNGFDVVKDPIFKGSDSYGFIVTKREKEIILKKEVLTKEDFDRVKCISYAATLKTPYENIVKVFGKPNGGVSGDNKVSCEWMLKTLDNKTIITIYDYKVGIPYLGSKGLEPEQIKSWSIGSNNKDTAPDIVYFILLKKLGSKNFQITRY